MLAVRAYHAAKPDLPLCAVSQWQYDISRVNARKLSENRARAVAKPGAGLPLLKRLPQRVGEKADQDVCLDAVLLAVPDRANAQIGLLDAESGFSFAQLNVGLPQFFVGPVVDVAAQDVRPFT